ncbi:MAG: hypothetical protein OXI64_12000 [Defluviicoccus sp.]|nr:hypothetical protein [Defluviicoccus sp.]
MAARPYRVLSPVHADRLYEPGEEIALEAAAARQLIEAGAIEDPDNPGTGPAPEPAGIFERALDALRTAPATEVREFLSRIADDPEIRDKAEEAFDPGSVSGTSLHAAALDAVRGLDPDDKSLWTQSGAPKVEAVEAVLGRDIDAAQRDAAWAIVEAERKEDE